AAAEAAKDGALLLEVGPGRTLATLARQSLDKPGPLAVLPCLGPVQAPGSDVQNLLQAVGQVWLAGVQPDWEALQPGRRRRVPLPTHPFERKRCWVQPMPLGTTGQPAAQTGTGTASDAIAAPADAGVATDVEQLIRMQLALISEQLGAIGGAGGTGRGD